MAARDRRPFNLRAAIANGQRQAREVLAFREGQRRKRSLALRRAVALEPAPPPPRRVLRALGPAGSAGVLLAEGDSWFDYPFHDVLEMLEDDFAYDVESVAHKGHRVEDMAYAKGQFEEFARRLEKLIRQGRIPRVILLSGGGNDLAGPELALLLNHAASTLPSINADVMAGIIDQRLQDAYATILAGLTTIATRYLNRPIPIIVHGYDYPVPDGRGYLGGFWVLPGPWLRPGFHQKGYRDLEQNRRHMKTLIDRFNAMLERLSAAPTFGHVHYLNLRGTLGAAPYRDYWDNELHPTKRGFRLVTQRFAELIAKMRV